MRRMLWLLMLPFVTLATSRPADARWVKNSATLAKYVNNTAPVGGGVKLAIIKPGSLLKVVAKSLGDVPLDVSMAPVGPVYVTESVINNGQEYRHCTHFTTCTHRSIAGGTGYKLVCTDGASGGPACLSTDIPITGLKLIVVDSLVATGKAKVVFVAK